MNSRPSSATPGMPALAVVLSVLALSIPLVIAVFFAEAAGNQQSAFWALALIPAFLLAYHRGWRGAVIALIAGICVFALGQGLAHVMGQPTLPWPSLVAVTVLIGGSIIGIGYVSELLHRERLLAQQNALDLTLIVDQEGAIRHASASAPRVLGYAPGQLVGKPAAEIVHPEDREALQKLVANGRPDGSAKFVEMRFHTRAGDWRLLQAVPGDLHPVHRIKGIVLNCRDVTDRKELEEQLYRVERMQAVGRLAGGLAHDFNNVLTVIRGHSSFLQESLDPDHPGRADLEEIQKAAEHAASLTRQLLAFSRQQVLRPETLDLNATVRKVEGMLRRLIEENIEFTTVLDPNLGQTEADPGQIEQILINLAVNAREAMPDGGRLTIETRNDVLTEEDDARYPYRVEPGPYVVLVVSDTGCGMDFKTLERIFEPFFTTKEHAEGIGLGLSTVYGIVKQSGGYIWVDSEVGQGTTFRVYLPMSEEAASEAAAGAPQREKAAAEEEAASGTVLLVEDNPSVRSIVRSVLMNRGYSVLEADNGREALQVVEDYGRPVDLLVSDLVMPELGGRELAEQLAERYPDMRVLLMSGYTADANLKRSIFGVDTAFLQKPFTPDEFLEAVRKVLTQANAA